MGQYFAAITNMRSVGCMGDERTYDYAIALRAVLTSDFMTAESAELPWEVLGKVTSRIVNEVKGVNRVLYDCTGKPPATIEFGRGISDLRFRICYPPKKNKIRVLEPTGIKILPVLFLGSLSIVGVGFVKSRPNSMKRAFYV